MKMEVARVVGLFVYPVKSCGGIAVDSMTVDAFGPKWDRRWMVVDQNGVFITQRKYSKMALIKTALDAACLMLEVPGADPLKVPFDDAEAGEKVSVRVWNDNVTARDCGSRINEPLSAFLGSKVKLVFLSSEDPRVRQKAVEFKVGFADSRPFLLANTASLADFNKRAQTDLPMSRFRPNIVVENSVAFSEDAWNAVKIGNVDLGHASACERCVITTIDQATGKKSGAEPLKTLQTFRAPEGAVLFGQHFIHSNPGTISMGDAVYET